MMNLDKRGEFEKLMAMYAEAELSHRRATERRHDALHRVVEFVNDHAAESIGAHVGVTASTDTIMREFVGWITADIPELHRVEVPLVAESLERFRKARGHAMQADLPWPHDYVLRPPTLTTMSGLDTLTDAPDATPFPLPDFIPPPPRAGLDPPVVHDPDAPAPQDRCLCKVCNDERARLRTLRRPPQVA